MNEHEARKTLLECAASISHELNVASMFARLDAELSEIKRRVERQTGRIVIISIGKAAIPMFREFVRRTQVTRYQAIVCSPYDNATGLEADFFKGGHPIPNEASIEAAQTALHRVSDLTTSDLVVYLIFLLVLIIALFNVIGSLIMMILDKKKNMKWVKHQIMVQKQRKKS